MEIDDALVAHVAQLARLGLSADEAQRLKSDFRRILAFVEKLDEVDTSDIEPSIFAMDMANVLRDDEPGTSLPPEDALGASPASRDGYFVVPRIVDTSAEFDPPPPADRADEAGA
ncbi:MAG: Asp-tRNA(Asn)/Glu-tRNA(Gln) amidotransferase subunit GatC [Planctomycetes bacterium]|nr:Asp-tRNA(Asn)/Glu-tRNA(Gln) amidotransferase subunit GatC [Planctomycetota bacterium]